MLVRDIMHPNVYCATVGMTVKELYLTLVGSGITGAPVLDDMDHLVGVVSLTNIAASTSKGIGSGQISDYYGRAHSKVSESEVHAIPAALKVGEIMSPRIHQVHYDTTVVEALELMLEERIHRVVVTHRGHVIGILTTGDLLRELRALLLGPDDEDPGDSDDDTAD